METSTKPIYLIGCRHPRALLLSLSAELSEPLLEWPWFNDNCSGKLETAVHLFVEGKLLALDFAGVKICLV